MKHSLKATSAYIAAFTLSISASPSFAQEYQYSTYIGLTDNNAYSATASGRFSYYFEPVDENLGPKELAPLLNKSSSVSLGYELTNFPMGDTRDQTLGPNLGFDWVFDNDIYVELYTASESTKYKASANTSTWKTKGNGVTVGYYLTDHHYLELGNFRETDNKNETFDSLYVSAGHLKQLQDDSYIGLRVTIENFINDDQEYNGNSYALTGSIFPNHKLSIYGTLTFVDFVDADDRKFAKLGARYFFDNSINAGLSVQMQKEGNSWDNRQYVHIGKRF